MLKVAIYVCLVYQLAIVTVIFVWLLIKLFNKEVAPSASHNTERECALQILLNCTSCRWRDQCIVKLNGDVCRAKYERKTSPIS